MYIVVCFVFQIKKKTKSQEIIGFFSVYISTYLFVHSIGSRKRNKRFIGNQIDKPNTETIAYIDLFSQLQEKKYK
jgi:hypothetical protein